MRQPLDLQARRSGREFREAKTTCIGPALVFGRLWQETGIRAVLRRLAAGRKFEFDVERAVFLTVLHRLFRPGSGRSAEKYSIPGTGSLVLHHLYRAMAWLGSPLGVAVGGANALCGALRKGPCGRSLVFPSPRLVQHAGSGVFRYDVDLF